MKRTVEEHAARFDRKADDYDDDDTEEYRACASLVVDHARADLGPEDIVLDLGCGTGAIGLALAVHCARVVGRVISVGMMERMREKAGEQGLESVEVAYGTFREPGYDGRVDAVVSNFAMHHLSDAEKHEAIEAIAGLEPRRFVLGDVMLFDEAGGTADFYDPAVDDPATVGVLADALTDAGFSLVAVEMVHQQAGVLVAERDPGGRRVAPADRAGSGSDPATGTATGADGDRE
jgi:SAM-dependent methyltransferase